MSMYRVYLWKEELNSFRARYQRDFKEIDKIYADKFLSEKDFEKYKQKHELKIENIRNKIRQLEEKIKNFR